MQMVLTRTLSGAYSVASAFVRLMPAARLTDVGRLRALGVLPLTVVMFTIRPSRWRCMCGSTSRHMRTAPITFSSQSSCHLASSTSAKGAAAEVPALFNRMSTRPQRCSAACASRSQSAATVTSAGTASTSAPVAARISSAARCRCSARRAAIATMAPSAASFCALARPSPSLPPVMMATLSFRPRSSMSCSS